MPVRPFRAADAKAAAELSALCARGETDFVLNPLWESEPELLAEFARRGGDPEADLLVAEGEDGTVVGLAGVLRGRTGPDGAGLLCPIVARDDRGRGVGGEILRAAVAHAADTGVKLLTAAVGTRNRAGYALLTGVGFRPARQVFLMRCDARPDGAAAPLAGLECGPASAEDAEAILAIYRTCGFEERSSEAMARVMQDGIHHHSVARHEGRVVAFVELETHWPTRPWVAFVGVAQTMRDRGVGSSLVGWAVAKSFEGGAQHALLILSPSNRTAVRAYEKVGFRRFRTVDVLERGL